MRILKVFVRAIGFIGILIGLANLLGLFVDSDRKEVFRALYALETVPVINDGADKVLDAFYYSKHDRKDTLLRRPEALSLRFVRIGEEPPIAGLVGVVFAGDVRPEFLCTLEQLRQWSLETPVYNWFGWALMVAAIVAETVMDSIGYVRKKLKKAPFADDWH